jgi:SSS family solute:Na+ symporter
VVISLYEGAGEDHPKAIDVGEIDTGSDPVYNVAAFGILGITAALYVILW